MLAKGSYPQDYVDACRLRFEAQLDAYRRLAGTADAEAVATFEPAFCSHLVLALDAYFVHRGRGQEGKDGNPLNEVRMLRDSILEHDAVLTANKSIRYRPENAVLGLEIGSAVALGEADAARLGAAYFDEIEERFVSADG